MIKPEKFLLIIGNARSGSTILGAALDAHPNMIIANETKESAMWWRGLEGEQIVSGILKNAERQASEDSRYNVCGQKSAWPPSSKQEIRVLGDKVWNPTTLLLSGKYDLIPSLEERLAAPITVIHACRNPFDVITTMHQKSGAPIGDRIRWYWAHCESVAAIIERLPANRSLHVHHEKLVQQTSLVLKDCCNLLDVSFDPEYLERCKQMLFSVPRQTRQQCVWTDQDILRVHGLIENFSWLKFYKDQPG